MRKIGNRFRRNVSWRLRNAPSRPGSDHGDADETQEADPGMKSDAALCTMHAKKHPDASVGLKARCYSGSDGVPDIERQLNRSREWLHSPDLPVRQSRV